MSNGSRSDQKLKVLLRKSRNEAIPLNNSCPRCGSLLVLSPSGSVRCYALGCGFGAKGNISLRNLDAILKEGTKYG